MRSRVCAQRSEQLRRELACRRLRRRSRAAREQRTRARGRGAAGRRAAPELERLLRVLGGAVDLVSRQPDPAAHEVRVEGPDVDLGERARPRATARRPTPRSSTARTAARPRTSARRSGRRTARRPHVRARAARRHDARRRSSRARCRGSSTPERSRRSSRRPRPRCSPPDPRAAAVPPRDARDADRRAARDTWSSASPSSLRDLHRLPRQLDRLAAAVRGDPEPRHVAEHDRLLGRRRRPVEQREGPVEAVERRPRAAPASAAAPRRSRRTPPRRAVAHLEQRLARLLELGDAASARGRALPRQKSRRPRSAGSSGESSSAAV